MKKHKLTIEAKRSWVGFSFIIIWLFGFLVFYLYPLIMSLFYTIYDPLTEKFAGFKFFNYVFTEDHNFLKNLAGGLEVVVSDLPGILVFSLVVALLLVQKFRGQGTFKVIFFLPIIMSSGLVLSYLSGDDLSQIMQSGERTGNLFQLHVLKETLSELGLGDDITSFIFNLVNNIFNLILKAGVQILLFIAGLGAISPSIYEAANIDGCTAWERFWKITFPLLSPIMLVVVVYTLTDSFIASGNPMMNAIIKAGQATNYSLSCTMAWIYMVIVLVIVAVVYLVFNRRVAYIDT